MINWNISSTYQHQSQALLKRYQQKEISLQEYESQLKQLKEQEIQSHAQDDIAQSRLAIQQYEDKQLRIWKQQQDDLKEKSQLDEQKEQQRLMDLAEAEKLRSETEQLAQKERTHQAEMLRKEAERKERELTMQPIIEYRDSEIPTALEEMRKRAKTNRRLSNSFQVIIILVSTVAAGIVNIENVPRLAISILTIIVAIVNGIVWIFKFKDKSVNSQQTADAIEYERNLYRLGIKDYAGKSPQEAYTLFAEHVEDLRNEQNKRQQLLEQNSDKPTETSGQ